MEALRRKVKSALLQAKLEDGFLDSWRAHFGPSVDEALKTCGEWLDRSDVYFLFHGCVARHIGEEPTKITAALTQRFSETQLDEMAGEVTDYVASLPHAYEVYFPLPALDIKRDVVLTPQISLIAGGPAVQSHLLLRSLGTIDLLPSTAYLRVPATGYIKYSAHGATMREATGLMKQIVQACVTKGAIGPQPFRSKASVLSDLLSGPSEKILQAVVFDRSGHPPVGGASMTHNVSLDSSCSRCLGSLVRVDDLVSPMFAAVDNTPEERFHARVRVIIDAITSDPPNEDTESLRSALEWAFEAASDQDPNSAFIKACIALEAALGEDTQPDRVTERLADRCAFLLSKTLSGRRASREAVREIYQLRSSLIHGNKQKLTRHEREVRDKGVSYLRGVLQKEIEAIEHSSRRPH